MNKIIFFLIAASFFIPVGFSEASVWVSGYYRSNGTYVSGHYRSEPNGLKYDNYSWNSGDDLYNNSYYSSGHNSNWYSPSYTWDSDYYSGYNYNQSYLGSDFDNDYAESYGGYTPSSYSWSY